MAATQIIVVILVAIVSIWPRPILGHARLWVPPGRSTMWRRGYQTPINYRDNELYCGGFWHQVSLGYKCGVCGDPYDGERENEAEGKYATGTVTRTYRQGEEVTFEVDVTANHRGYLEFKICPTNNPKVKETQDCFNRYPLALRDGSGTKYYIPSTTGMMAVNLALPFDLVCDFCVVQMRYHAGNNWGTDPDETSCVGCGPQEEFYGCADIRILSTGSLQTVEQGITSPKPNDSLQTIEQGRTSSKPTDSLQTIEQGITSPKPTDSLQTIEQGSTRSKPTDSLQTIEQGSTRSKPTDSLQTIEQGRTSSKPTDSLQTIEQGSTRSKPTDSLQTIEQGSTRSKPTDSLQTIEQGRTSSKPNGAGTETEWTRPDNSGLNQSRNDGQTGKNTSNNSKATVTPKAVSVSSGGSRGDGESSGALDQGGSTAAKEKFRNSGNCTGSDNPNVTVINGDTMICRGIDGQSNLDNWCQLNGQSGHCPPTHCRCVTGRYEHTAPRPDGCRAAGAYANVTGIDLWCVRNCKIGNCPGSHCVC